MENKLSAHIEESLSYLLNRVDIKPLIGIILGSGLGDFAETLENPVKISSGDIPHYPVSTVSGHEGMLIFGTINGLRVLAVKGRTHYYEGHSIRDVSYVVRIMARLGVRLLIVTNAAGGVNPRFSPGDLMIISDHINFMFRNPLKGGVLQGESRWTDMSDAYDGHYADLMEKTGLRLGIHLKKGVLFASTGPTYETAAEVKMARKFGADAVSMSTVPEVLVARANNIKVAGISCITNMATGISLNPLSHDEVTAIARQVRTKFTQLLKEIITVLGRQLK